MDLGMDSKPKFRSVRMDDQSPLSAPVVRNVAVRPDFWSNIMQPVAAGKQLQAFGHQFDGPSQKLADPLGPPGHAGLEVVPEWVEKYTSFYTSIEPLTVIKFLCGIFEHHNVDCESVGHASLCKLQAVGRDYFFMVQIFDTPTSDSEYLVELQRRSGDVIDFMQFYRSTLSMLGDLVSRTYLQTSGAPAPRPLAMPDTSAVDLDMATGEEQRKAQPLDESAVYRTLCEMARSEFVDVQREAFKELAKLSVFSTHQCQLLQNAGLVTSTLAVIFARPDQVTMRWGAMVLANLANHANQAELGQRILQQTQFIHCVFMMLDSPASLHTRETKRDFIRAIAGLTRNKQTAKALSSLQAADTYQAILRKFCVDADQRQQSQAQLALQNLQDVC